MVSLGCRWLVVLGVAACFLSTASRAMAQSPEPKEAKAGIRPASGPISSGPALSLEDVFDLEYASDPQISPDGKQVVYVRRSMDVMTDKVRSQLWSTPTRGWGAGGEDHRPLTVRDQDVSLPRFSPDGRRLAYVVAEDGGAQIAMRWIDSGQTSVISQLPHKPSNLVWSPGGDKLAFTMLVEEEQEPLFKLPGKPKDAKWAEPFKVIRDLHYRADGQGYLASGYHQLFFLPADGGTPRQLTEGEFHHRSAPSWSADGQSLIFSANRHKDWRFQPRNSELNEVALRDRKIKSLTSRNGPDDEPAVSPDGKLIAYVGFDDQRLGYQIVRLHVMQRYGGESRVLTTELDRDVQNPQWKHDGTGLYFQYDDRGNTKLGFAPLKGALGTVAQNVGGTSLGRPYASGSFSVSDNDWLAFTHTSPNSPAEVAVTHATADGSRFVTQLNRDLLSYRTLGKTEEIRFESSFDGREIHGWAVYPPEFDKNKQYPLLLEIHGGPFANYGGRFSTEIQLYAAAGYVVLYINPRGSTSYGQDFGNLIHHAYPGRDYDDLMSGVDELISRGFIDKDQLYVTGGSGGGILTSWVVGKTDRFRAAVAAKPVINWYSFVLTTDMYPYFTQYWFSGPPWENAEEYLRRSPLSLVGNVSTPTMLMTGENDHRTPISESEQFYQALKLRGIDTMLIRVPGSSHAIAARPSHLIAKVGHILKWFEMHREE